MNRTEFIVATAIILFVAFVLGWFANWLVHRFMRIGQSEMGEVDKMAQQLHEAEAAFRRLATAPKSLDFYLDYALTNYRAPEREITESEGHVVLKLAGEPALDVMLADLDSIERRRANTTVTVKDGETVVIGLDLRALREV